MAANNSGSGYQQGTTAAPINAHRVLASNPQKIEASGTKGVETDVALPKRIPIHNAYNGRSAG